jgi:RNA polymerase sigma-70 factor (ECF subfamily)
MSSESPHAESLLAHERFLWSLCYRMTGQPADADDLVQETFTRALERPPADLSRDLRPWLVRVAMNLARDNYRRRRRQPNVGPWLPGPVDTDLELAGYEPRSTEGRYELMESVSLAFLVALEALTPNQRAVLLLRDVLEYSVRETAGALSISEANVKTLHHRARRAMEAYDQRRPPVLPPDAEQIVARFVFALASQDEATVLEILAPDAVSRSDAGGEYKAALRPIRGREKVARFLLHLTRKAGPGASAELVRLNGLPSLWVEIPSPHPREAPRVALCFELDGRGRVQEVYIVLASRKLRALKRR